MAILYTQRNPAREIYEVQPPSPTTPSLRSSASEMDKCGTLWKDDESDSGKETMYLFIAPCKRTPQPQQGPLLLRPVCVAGRRLRSHLLTQIMCPTLDTFCGFAGQINYVIIASFRRRNNPMTRGFSKRNRSRVAFQSTSRSQGVNWTEH